MLTWYKVADWTVSKFVYIFANTLSPAPSPNHLFCDWLVCFDAQLFPIVFFDNYDARVVSTDRAFSGIGGWQIKGRFKTKLNLS